MKDGMNERGFSRFTVNGYKLTRPFLASRSVGEAAAPDSVETADKEATRYLSAATQLDIDYAKSVVDRVFNEQLKALAPTFGVDVPVVVKWALKALRIRAIRDRWLTVILALQIFLIVVLILWWPWVWIPLVLLLLVAWMVVSWDYHERIHKAVIGKMLRDRFRPVDAPWPTNGGDRDRLDTVAARKDGNLVVFSGHEAFIGSGKLMAQQRILLDISGVKDDDGEAGKQPESFTSQDLHTAIVAAFDREHGLGKSLDNIRVYERLFVNGLHIQSDENLLPDRLRPPPTSVESSLLNAAAENPSPEARAYVCVEMPGWQGQLVVTQFIRAVYAGKSLFVEWTFMVLPPIRKEFRRIDTLYEFSSPLQLKDSLLAGLRALVPALARSPVRAFGAWRYPRLVRRRQLRRENAIKRGYLFDYGARTSIREDASGDQRQHYFLARDEIMYVLLAQQTLTRAVEDFLSEHGVDLGQFKDQVKVIFDSSINYNIGDISGSTGFAIGNNSSATVNEPKKEPK